MRIEMTVFSLLHGRQLQPSREYSRLWIGLWIGVGVRVRVRLCAILRKLGEPEHNISAGSREHDIHLALLLRVVLAVLKHDIPAPAAGLRTEACPLVIILKIQCKHPVPRGFDRHALASGRIRHRRLLHLERRSNV